MSSDLRVQPREAVAEVIAEQVAPRREPLAELDEQRARGLDPRYRPLRRPEPLLPARRVLRNRKPEREPRQEEIARQ